MLTGIESIIRINGQIMCLSGEFGLKFYPFGLFSFKTTLSPLGVGVEVIHKIGGKKGNCQGDKKGWYHGFYSQKNTQASNNSNFKGSMAFRVGLGNNHQADDFYED
jgi:hypothetical protein